MPPRLFLVHFSYPAFNARGEYLPNELSEGYVADMFDRKPRLTVDRLFSLIVYGGTSKTHSSLIYSHAAMYSAARTRTVKLEVEDSISYKDNPIRLAPLSIYYCVPRTQSSIVDLVFR